MIPCRTGISIKKKTTKRRNGIEILLAKMVKIKDEKRKRYTRCRTEKETNVEMRETDLLHIRIVMNWLSIVSDRCEPLLTHPCLHFASYLLKSVVFFISFRFAESSLPCVWFISTTGTFLYPEKCAFINSCCCT